MAVKLFIFLLVAVLIMGLFLLFSKQHKKQKHGVLLPVIFSPETATFSGDDQKDTELDLAQAYLELHHYEKAKHLLKAVIISGNVTQIAEARKMFAVLLKKEKKICNVLP